MGRKRVVITGIGIVAPNGVGKKQFSTAIFNGLSGIALISLFNPNGSKINIAGEIKNFDPISYMPPEIFRKVDRFVHLGLAATHEALADSGVHESKDLLNASVIIGSGQGGLSFHEQIILDYVSNKRKPLASSVPRITSNAVSAHIAIRYGIKGLNHVISTACSSGTQAIGQAFRNIAYGLSDLIITGGVEAPISPVMIEMYNSMLVLSNSVNGKPELASRPFDLTRNGFVLSEGAGILILESLEHASKRKAYIYAEIIGFGSSCGAYHMVTPNPSGEDAAEVMNLAMADAGLSTEKIDYISAHGTSTKQNDLAETNAIKKVFGKTAYKVPISSIKSMIGHTIGASGAIQAVANCLSLQCGVVPPTINLQEPDPLCDLDYVPHESREVKVKTIILNSFGFGSNNAALIMTRFN